MRKRIAIYTSSFPPKTGGIASAHFNLFHKLSKEYDVKAFVFRDSDRSVMPNVIRAKPLPGQTALFKAALRGMLKQPLLAKDMQHCDAIAETAAAVTSMNGRLKKFSPDFIICPDHYVPALLLQKPPSSKLLWMARNNYLRFTKQPLVPPRNFRDLLLAHRLERRALQKADAVMSPSEYMLDVFRDSFEYELPMRVAKNFVDVRKFENIAASNLREILEVGSTAHIIYFPSAGNDMKGGRYLYEIVRRVASNGPLGIYISGSVPNYLQHELNSIGDHVKCYMPGHVDYKVNLSHVAACDLTVSPTLIENLSNALVESILQGIPVITFDTGGNKEIIMDGKTGIVVPHADVDALVKAISNLIATDSRLEQLKESCSRYAEEIIDVDKIIDSYSRLFEELSKNDAIPSN